MTHSQRKWNTLLLVLTCLGLLSFCCVIGLVMLWKLDLLTITPSAPAEPPDPVLDLPNEESDATDTYSLLIVNATAVQICSVQISPVTREDWGANYGSILPGAALDIDIPAGRYDLRALDCDAAVHHVAQINSADDPTVIIGGANKVQLHVQNASPDTVCYLQASLTHEDAWGEEDLLGAVSTLSPGESRYVYLYPGEYDLRVLNCAGDTLFAQYHVNLTDTTPWVLEKRNTR
jgi:hypothetical protein